MRVEIEELANEVRILKSQSVQPRFSKLFKERVGKLLNHLPPCELAKDLGLARSTLHRWQQEQKSIPQSSNTYGSESPNTKYTFSPVVVTQPQTDNVDDKKSIHLDMTYRDGRRLVIDLPATNVNAQELISTLKQEFFKGV